MKFLVLLNKTERPKTLYLKKYFFKVQISNYIMHNKKQANTFKNIQIIGLYVFIGQQWFIFAKV